MTTNIFLSYARGDDEPFVKRLHADLSTAGFNIWFDRVSMPSRRLTFHQEIRDAIAAQDRLVLVIGPKAVSSDYVTQEWQFAWCEADKVVTPILRLGDYPLIPDELKLLHCEDFRDDSQYRFHLENLIRQLREPVPSLGKLIAVPSLPPHYLRGTERLSVPARLRFGPTSTGQSSSVARRQGWACTAWAASASRCLPRRCRMTARFARHFPMASSGSAWARCPTSPALHAAFAS